MAGETPDGAVAALSMVMLLGKKREIGQEIARASAFALLVGFIYYYFGPAPATLPSFTVIGLLTLGMLGVVATVAMAHRQRKPETALAKITRQKRLEQLADGLHRANWNQLDKAVTNVYAHQGCPTWRQQNVEGEHSFSLIIERGGEKAAVMCKPWNDAAIASPEIIEFSTALKRGGLARGVLVSMREVTMPALAVAQNLRIEILNEEGLIKLLAWTDEEGRGELLATLRDPAIR